MESGQQNGTGAAEVIIAPREKALTIGAVRKTLAKEFGDVSISKIRYLEDQKLVSPRRTPGGYRLYSQADVARLRTILRLQRDEFLPLKVIRQELAVGRSDGAAPRKAKETGAARPGRLPSVVPASPEASFSRGEMLEETRAKPELVDELVLYLAPRLLGPTARPLAAWPDLERLADSPSWQVRDLRQIGPDIRIMLRRH